jgi:hypothetical protein
MNTGPEIFYGIGAVILAAVIVWAILRNRTRNHANDPITDAATREEYRHPDGYDPEKFRAGLKPRH